MGHRLRKSLDGLKQSLHVWYCSFTEFVIWIGLGAPGDNGGLLVIEDHDIVIAAVTLHVDNLHMIANER
jgi:hypothetical protein